MKKILKYCKKNYYLFFLLLFVVLARLPMLLDQMIPFQFDHGKDAIGSFYMLQTLDPKLIGPWTSIPGLFFGPAWYYILLPGMLLSQGAPIASVVTMLFLGLSTIALIYVYFGKIEATLFATSSLFYTITTSAWNPFPMVCLTFIILAVLKKVEEHKKLEPITAGLLGFLSALGFHFSTAFAIFYPLLIVSALLIKKTKWTARDVLTGLMAFVVPFIPQILFEIKHNFIEVKAVLTYLEKGDSDPASGQKLQTILATTFGEMKDILFPGAYFAVSALNVTIFALFVFLFVVSLYFFIKNFKQAKHYLLVDAALWFTVPILAFTALHFNVWYVLPLLAFTFILVGQVLRSAPKKYMYAFVGLCFVVSLSKVLFYITEDRENLLKSPVFLPNKYKAIEYVYEKAGNKPFASYQYMPDIYDFPYQYIYLKNAYKGKPLPVEFSYKPGETAYIPEKNGILAKFPNKPMASAPELIFYIVEKSDNKDLYDRWWSEQKYGEIIAEHVISDGLIVYTATPAPSKQH